MYGCNPAMFATMAGLPQYAHAQMMLNNQYGTYAPNAQPPSLILPEANDTLETDNVTRAMSALKVGDGEKKSD